MKVMSSEPGNWSSQYIRAGISIHSLSIPAVVVVHGSCYIPLFLFSCFRLCITFFSVQCRIQTFFGHTIFLKLRIGQFSDTQKTPMFVIQCPKICDVQCIQGSIFVSLEKTFLFLSFCKLYLIQFLHEIYMAKLLQELFWADFFWMPILFKLYLNTSG